MNKSFVSTLGILAGVAVIIPATSFAASVVLTNGGLGQVASNPSQFGVAVCDNGSAAMSQSVPVTISANGQSATVSSAASIAVGACAYTYIPYSQFGMQAGKTYQVAVAINGGSQSTYSATVPGGQAAMTTPNGSGNTADVNVQSSNIFVAFWHWLVNLF